MKKNLIAALFAIATIGSAQAGPAYTATGVQNDVSYDAVVNGGWSVLYRGDYSGTFNIASLISSIGAGKNVMLAALRDGATAFEVLSYAKKEEVFTLTGDSATHAANGAEWYFNDQSIGFAGLGDIINQSSADINGSTWQGTPERDRLSWHTWNTQNGIEVYGGWRAGTFIELNGSTDWDRLILVQDAPTDPSEVPEPGSIALLGLGLAGLAAARRRKQA